MYKKEWFLQDGLVKGMDFRKRKYQGLLTRISSMSINLGSKKIDSETRGIHTLKVLELYKKQRDYPVIYGVI